MFSFEFYDVLPAYVEQIAWIKCQFEVKRPEAAIEIFKPLKR